MAQALPSTENQFNSFRNQYYAVFIGNISNNHLCRVILLKKIRLNLFPVNLIMFAHSCFIGWLAPGTHFSRLISTLYPTKCFFMLLVLPHLISEDTHLVSGPLTVGEISWLGAGSSLGAFPGAFVFGWIISRSGVRRTIFFSTFYILVKNNLPTHWRINLLVLFGYSVFFTDLLGPHHFRDIEYAFDSLKDSGWLWSRWARASGRFVHCRNLR